MLFKNILRTIIPKDVRFFISGSWPKIHKINTYILKNPVYIESLSQIAEKYSIREISWDDGEKLQKAYDFRSPDSYRRKVISRLNAREWTGLAVFDKATNDIAYIAWIINGSIRYFEEFGIFLKQGQYLLKDGYCVPEYRHQGLHTRMEQERINYCLRNGAREIFIQIHDSNKKGIVSVTENGYELYRQDYVIQWPVFNIYRALRGFLKSPFRKVVK